MELLALPSIVVYTCVSAVLLFKIWRQDAFFAVFMTLMVLYSVIAQWGYFLFPEISELVLRMYFGLAPLTAASLFSTLSLFALFLGFKYVYRPLTKSIAFSLYPTRRVSGLFAIACLLSTASLAFGYLYYRNDLNYSNASDEIFLDSSGKSYVLFVQIYKFSVFMMLVMYAAMRDRVLSSALERGVLFAFLGITTFFFLATTIGSGSRTDPLALILGLIGFEYYRSSKHAMGVKSISRRMASAARSNLKKRLVIAAVALVFTAVLLSILEATRSGQASAVASLEASQLVQTVLLKDYHPPFHLLIGAMSNDYIDPLAVLASNAANSLMFLRVDFLQAFVVNQWESGLVTRTASPALFAFTEGFVALGWAGFVYNGVVWAAGLALWRRFSRTGDQRFNAIAFAITMALAASVPRSQSAYFIKDIYLFFLPALAIYCLAAGLSPFKVHRRPRLYANTLSLR